MQKNNFDFLRLIFSMFVIITHSIPLSGSGSQDLLELITAKQIDLSYLGLAGFFTISGYLVFESLKRSTTIFSYYKKRVLRIYPGLFVSLIIAVLIGCTVTTVNITRYFSDPSPWRFLFLHLGMFFERPHHIIGVFTNNRYPEEVNGALWSIQFEFLFYIILSSLFWVRKQRVVVLMIVVLAYIAAILIFYGKDIIVPGYLYYYINKTLNVFTFDKFFTFGLYFCAGVILSNFQGLLRKHRLFFFIGSIILAIIFLVQHTFTVANRFVLPILIISFGLMETKGINNLSKKIGDPSYGIYIYGFLIQQTLMYYFELSYLELALLTIPVSIVFGYLSWTYVEKPFLRLKQERVNMKPLINV